MTGMSGTDVPRAGDPEAPVPEAPVPEAPSGIAPAMRAVPAMPRGVLILVALASGFVVAFGIHLVSGILGPLFLALVLTIAAFPVRNAMVRRGLPHWLGTLAVVTEYVRSLELELSVTWASPIATVRPLGSRWRTALETTAVAETSATVMPRSSVTVDPFPS